MIGNCGSEESGCTVSIAPTHTCMGEAGIDKGELTRSRVCLSATAGWSCSPSLRQAQAPSPSTSPLNERQIGRLHLLNDPQLYGDCDSRVFAGLAGECDITRMNAQTQSTRLDADLSVRRCRARTGRHVYPGLVCNSLPTRHLAISSTHVDGNSLVPIDRGQERNLCRLDIHSFDQATICNNERTRDILSRPSWWSVDGNRRGRAAGMNSTFLVQQIVTPTIFRQVEISRPIFVQVERVIRCQWRCCPDIPEATIRVKDVSALVVGSEPDALGDRLTEWRQPR